ncbi:MAG TPA: zinc-dependent metalloprotease [Gemmatimonas sp.]|uniref:zinc-dependent metalloprotease n=1 Tax=Gemmatimonas sp. TaxID=1962908 RepID=UPI002EDB6F7A
MHNRRYMPLLAAGLVFAACRPAAKPATAPTPNAPAGANNRPAGPTPAGPTAGQPPAGAPNLAALAGAMGAQGEPAPRPYASVITSRAKSKDGVFGVHQVGARLYFEIPAAQLGKDFMVTTVLSGTNAAITGSTNGPTRLVRFERRDNRILLRDVNYNNVASDTTLQTARAMSLIEFFPILASFNVDAYGKDSASVIDVTRLFTGGVQEFTANGRRATVDASRSFIDKFSAFSRNVNVTAVQTFTPVPTPGAAPLPIFGGGGAPGTSTEAYTFSVVRLPDDPMMPRLYDERVGYFSRARTDFGSREQRVLPRRYISRWRLECSAQKQGNLCVPKKPITYYVDPATPAWLVPWVKAGIEEWQPAFEAAGFSKGIVAGQVPNDPEFSGEDASVAMIRWLPSPVANAQGPSLVDPRTGEIIDADVQMYHNILDLQREWYFSQVGHLDKRAQTFPFPDSLMGRLIQFVVAHEVGHTLGFPHNFKGSSMYPLDSVRSKTWVAKMGHSPSIMDYARFNYVAQPEDNIPLADLVPRVGVYDTYAVKWGYSPIPGATTPEAELRQLDAWARMQDTVPWYRFASDAGAGGADPGEQSEAIGDADAVAATALGFKNIARVMKLVDGAASADKTADFSLLRATYNGVVGQWALEANHVAKIVGGLDKQEKRLSQSGPVWTPVSRARQKAAVKFLNEQVFATPAYLTDVPTLRRLESEGNINRVVGAQARALNSLLNNTKLQRLVEIEATSSNQANVYSVGEMLTDVRRGVWSEVASGKPITAYRRRLQNVYLEQMATKIKPPATSPAEAQIAQLLGIPLSQPRDFRAIVKDEVRTLDRELAGAIGRSSDRASRAHMQDARDQIKTMLDTDK